MLIASKRSKETTTMKMTGRYSVKVSVRFVALSLVSCMLVAFAVGHIARVLLVDRPQKAWLLAHPETTTTFLENSNANSKLSMDSRWVVVTEQDEKYCISVPGNECPFFQDPQQQEQQPSLINDSIVTASIDDDQEVGRRTSPPACQHLLVDIENVDASFLSSQDLLVGAMRILLEEYGGLTLLCYFCHGLPSSGVSCVGVLLEESHVSFHTWPFAGVIALDLFTCQEESLLPMVSKVEQLFSIPQPPSSLGGTDKQTKKQPQILWAHKYRGFGDDDEEEKADLTDFFSFPIGVMTDFKKQVWSEQTDFQRFDVVDVLRTHAQNMEGYQRSLLENDDGSYESRNPKLFEPDRIVFLDGVMQSRRSGDAAYHEALVHPGMFVHENPKRVAIIGGGEGATLREVLKHNTVEKVVMIEIDEKMVKLSREHLPDWSDCSMLQGSTDSCFDDPRVDLYCEDAFAWFIDRFSGEQKLEEPFDVIIMDALDPQVQKAFVDALYDGGPFLGSLPAAITDNGVLIAQVGEVATLDDPAENLGLHRNRVNFIRSLTDLGFQVVREYDEAHGGFEASWVFIVAAKNANTMTRWVSESSMVEYLIRKRMKPTKDGVSPLQFFDGATMKSFAFPTKASEVVFCRRFPDLPNCKSGHGFDHERENIPISALALKAIDTAAGGTGVFATRDIPSMSYIGLEDAVHRVYLKSYTADLLQKMNKKPLVTPRGRSSIEKAVAMIEMFGRQQRKSDQAVVTAETNLHAFINVGCKNANVGQHPQVTLEEDSHVYNPIRDRQVHLLHGAYPSKDIAEGDELLLQGLNDDDC